MAPILEALLQQVEAEERDRIVAQDKAITILREAVDSEASELVRHASPDALFESLGI